MKKKIIIIAAAIAVASILLAASFAACSLNEAKAPSSSDTESATLELPTHLSPDEQQESESDSDSSLATEPQTEQTSDTEESPKDSDNIDSESSETEPTPALSLDYISHGNGTCSVSGIGNIVDSYITIPLRSPDGDVVTSIEDGAFCGNEFIRAVEIPSTVSYIGDMAFSDCSELVYISVDKANKTFCDVGGVLFTSDMTRLLAYPSASGASTISIPSSVIKIAPMAFFECNNLKTIEYQGTAAEWSKIVIGEMNYGLFSTSIICADTSK